MALVIKTPSTMSIRNHAIIVLLTLCIIGLGYYFSVIHLLGTEWVSRSGSLIVVLGIMSGFSGIIQERIIMSRLEVSKRIEILQKKRKLRLLKVDKEFAEKELESIENKFVEQADVLTQSIKFNVGLIEGVLLMLGTIIWGFGDILFTFIK